MNIAIIGAGLSGLASAWHLLQKGHSLTIFDTGNSASEVSTGLMHPYLGKRPHRTWRADEGMTAALELIDLAEKELDRPVANRSGIFRPAIDGKQSKLFQRLARQYDDIDWVEKHEMEGLVFPSGLLIKSGITVFSSLYLKGLRKICEKQGAIFQEKRVKSLEELSDFNQIILAAGAGIRNFPEAQIVPLDFIKGQVLFCRSEGRKLPMSIVSKGHISHTEEENIFVLGSTYERNWDSLEPDIDQVKGLKEQIARFYEPAKDFEVLHCSSGVRVARKGFTYRPVSQRLNDKTWVITALGSRGLIYHAILAKDMAQTIQ